jgi:hypothetical protein
MKVAEPRLIGHTVLKTIGSARILGTQITT